MTANHHPYKTLGNRHFWARAVADGFDPGDVGTLPVPLIEAGQKVMSAGSCFAAALVPHLEGSGFEYVKTTLRPPVFDRLGPDNFSYDTFSAAYGNIYTAAHLLQVTQRCIGAFSPREDRWHGDNIVIDPFRPGLRFPATSDREFDLLTEQYLRTVAAAFRTCDVFIFTIGLTEAWRSKLDGAVFPACPGTIAGTFDSAAHEFVNFTVGEVADDLNAFVKVAREINPTLRIILTVSPVPLVATATRHHVLEATVYSKSVLRAAVGQVVQDNEDVVYFPSYELLVGPQAPKDVFEPDKRSVSAAAVAMVMSLFLSKCAVSIEHDHRASAGRIEDTFSELSADFAKLECEEVGQDDRYSGERCDHVVTPRPG